MNSPRRLWLLRHPQPVVAAGICYGRTDLAADADALTALVNAVRQRIPPGLPLLTSPLRRCRELADALAACGHGIGPAREDARWAEMHFGEWENCAWDGIARPALDAWAADFMDYCPPGGESVRQVATRVDAAYETWRTGNGDALVVTHAGPMQLLARRLRGQPLNQQGPRLPYGAVVEFRLDAHTDCVTVIDHP